MITQLTLELCQGMTPYFIIVIVLGYVFYAFTPPGKRAGNHGPSILTMLGILGTFVGIVVGFLNFNENDIQSGLPQLISGLRSAFLASAFGVFFAIVLKFQKSLASSSRSRQPSFDSMAETLESIRVGLVGDGESTLVNQITLMRSNTNDRLDKILQSQDNFLKEMAKSNSEALIEALKDVMRDFNAKINEQFGDNFKQLNEAVGKLLIWQEQYKTIVDDLVVQEKISAESLTVAAERLAQIVDRAETFTLLSSELSKILANIEKYGSNLNALTESANVSMDAMAKSVSAFEKNMGTAFENATRKIQELTQNTNSSLENASKKIQTQVDELDASLEREITKALESMARQFVSISEKFASDYTPLAEKLREVMRIAS